MHPLSQIPMEDTALWAGNWWSTAVHLLLACVLASAIGWDREARGRAAGLRTHIIVALGAAGFTIMSMRLAEQSDAVDPARIIGGVVGGIGFLGAGAIIQSGGDIRGLTTAAGLWLTASIGVASGLAYYPVAIGLTVLGVIVIAGLRRAEQQVQASEKTD